MAKKTLYILRHGKSSWADYGQPDLDRPLNKRGQRAARRMGTEVARRGWRPDVILCSPARRTRATLDLFTEGWDASDGEKLPPARIETEFYLADARIWLRHIREQAPGHPAILVIGHNPGLHDLAIMLSGSGADDLRQRLARRFTTCALAVIGFEGDDWHAAAPGAGSLRHLLYPKELEESAGG